MTSELVLYMMPWAAMAVCVVITAGAAEYGRMWRGRCEDARAALASRVLREDDRPPGAWAPRRVPRWDEAVTEVMPAMPPPPSRRPALPLRYGDDPNYLPFQDPHPTQRTYVAPVARTLQEAS